MNQEEIELAKFIAVQLHNEGITEIPEFSTAVYNSYEVILEDSTTFYINYKGEKIPTEYGWAAHGQMKYREEYDDDVRITRDEFVQWMEENPNYAENIKAKQAEVMEKIAELNRQAYEAVKEAMELSHSVDLPYSCRMPAGVADLDENSNWDSSRC